VKPLSLAESFPAWCAEFGITLFPWQQEAFGGATRRSDGRFVHRLAAISTPRGDGKSMGSAAVASWRLICAPAPTLVVSVALDREGALITLRHGRSILRGIPGLQAEFLSDEIRMSTGSRWIVRSRDHMSSRGLHPDVCLLDEADWNASDELYSSLLAGQASCPDALMIITSTVARADGLLARVRALAEEESEVPA
jgi:phage terminase large subunit-like protein